MIFATYWFFLFAAAFFPVYWLAQRPGLRLALLLAFCALFHAHFAGAAGMKPILVLGIVTYLAALSRRRWAVVTAMGLAVVALGFYKYSHFLALDVIAPLWPGIALPLDQALGALRPATPPLAISFFTFEFVHYLSDVAKGSPAIRNPAKFAAFAFFFPSLVAGPIKRYQPFLGSLGEGLSRGPVDDVKVGLIRVATGLFKKIVIADNLTAAVDFWQPKFVLLSLAGRWEVFLAIAARILMDFSGYSDIAIGLARMMGITLPENFNWAVSRYQRPGFLAPLAYFSQLGWIRDYVYVPLGGNRRGVPRKILNGLIAFGLIGLWHGPAWHFVGWGFITVRGSP